ncbi:MAG: hypothetical protein ACK4L8_00080 [Nitrincola lacisaponensis]|uniref:hypothetical protein n=1 Tax=Nitrincola lacisaponensis TaxID=267850 RepID=UPI00391B3FD9
MKAGDLTYLKRWVGKLVIYQTPKNAPAVVYITGVSKKGNLRGKELNTTNLFIGHPRYCIEYRPRLMDRMLFAYQYRHACAVVAASKKRLIRGVW